ncbi:hypothetical protein [Bradyrhizobium sp. STM 3566]|uniref:hypothetical protein n=1 Tax=Bradyrhizobium sp. STM 3566 TaxID=578928 RepID=UPI00388FDF25
MDDSFRKHVAGERLGKKLLKVAFLQLSWSRHIRNQPPLGLRLRPSYISRRKLYTCADRGDCDGAMHQGMSGQTSFDFSQLDSVPANFDLTIPSPETFQKALGTEAPKITCPI